jgi:DNA-binding CsgD family transcriptional regulator
VGFRCRARDGEPPYTFGAVTGDEPGGDPGQLLERERELASIDQALELARAGDGQLLLIDGPAGAGKTSLVQAVRAKAAAGRLTVLSARGGELEQTFPYGVARQLFEPVLARAPNPRREALLRGAARLAAPALGLAEGDEPAGRDSEHAARHGLYWVCANLAEEGPLVVAVDDAQWADPPSLAWLAYSARRLEDLPVLLVVAARTAEPGEGTAAITQIAGDLPAVRLHPQPLGQPAVTEWLAGAFRRHPDPEFAQACRQATGGNPFLVLELVRALGEQGVEPAAKFAAQVSEQGPETIASGLAARLGRFPKGAEELSRALALLGSRGELGHVAALAGLDLATAEEAADALARASVLNPGRPLEFVHPVVRQATYAQLSETERARGHARAAGLLREAGAPLDELAIHLLATEPSGDPATVETLRAAARAATARGAPGAAVSYLRRAVREPPAEEERDRALMELGAAESQAGEPTAVGRLAEAAEAARDPRLRAQALRQLAWTQVVSGSAGEGAKTFEEAIAATPDDDRDLRMEVEAELIATAQMGLLPPAVARSRLRTIDAEAITGGSPGEQALLGVLAFEAIRANRPSEIAAELAERAIDGPMLTGDRLTDSPPLVLVMTSLLYSERLDLLGRLVVEGREQASRRGSLRAFVICTFVNAHVLLRQGALASAAAEALEAAWTEGIYEPGIQMTAAATGAQALVECGQLDEAHRVLRRAGVADTPAEEIFLEEPVYARGTLALAQGDARRARDDLRACGRRLLAHGSVGVGPYRWRSRAALAHAALGEIDEAQSLVDEELELAREFGTPRTIGAALHAAGLLAEGDRSIDLLAEAAATLDAAPAPLERAKAHVDLGAAMRRAGHRTDAREPLRRGLDAAFRCGASSLVERAREELAAAGARPRRPVISGRDALTPSETRVARMAAEGRANPEIAQALFVSRKTVEMHLSRVYRKLDIGSRDDLPAALAGEALGTAGAA